MPVSLHMLGEDDEDGLAEVAEAPAEAVAEDAAAEDENIDLAAVLGGGIKKAPAAATELEVEAEPAHAEVSA